MTGGVRRPFAALVVGALLLLGSACSGDNDDASRPAPEPGKPVTVATFEKGFRPRGVGVDRVGNVYTSGWDGKRFMLVAVRSNGKQRRTPIPCTTRIGFDNFFDVGFAIAPDGTAFWSMADQNRVVRIAPDGSGDCFAGSGARGFSGDGGSALEAQLYRPSALAFDSEHEALYITDEGNRRIRRVAADGTIETVVQPSPNQQGDIHTYGALAFDSEAGRLYFVDDPIGTLETDGRVGSIEYAGSLRGEAGAGSLAVQPGSGALYAGGLGDGPDDCASVSRVRSSGDGVLVKGVATTAECADYVAVDRSRNVWLVDGAELRVVGPDNRVR